MTGTVLRSGIDMIEVERFRKLASPIRERFLERVFTPAERALCAGREERLAGRFACKEAVAKALGTGIGKISWQDIEILSDEAGQPQLKLSGEALAVAESSGLTLWSVSISHLHDYAVAMAVASG